MESDRRLKPEEEPRPPGPGLGPGLASLLPADADDEDADRSAQSVLSAASVRPVGQTRDLNEVVHRILIIGLLVSTALLLIGLLLDLLADQTLAAAVLRPDVALQRALALDPAGFLSLGLLVLMFTPVVRVIGSIVVFLWERDWLYFAVTVFVFIVMLVSVIFGRV